MQLQTKKNPTWQYYWPNILPTPLYRKIALERVKDCDKELKGLTPDGQNVYTI